MRNSYDKSKIITGKQLKYSRLSENALDPACTRQVFNEMTAAVEENEPQGLFAKVKESFERKFTGD